MDYDGLYIPPFAVMDSALQCRKSRFIAQRHQEAGNVLADLKGLVI